MVTCLIPGLIYILPRLCYTRVGGFMSSEVDGIQLCSLRKNWMRIHLLVMLFTHIAVMTKICSQLLRSWFVVD